MPDSNPSGISLFNGALTGWLHDMSTDVKFLFRKVPISSNQGYFISNDLIVVKSRFQSSKK